MQRQQRRRSRHERGGTISDLGLDFVLATGLFLALALLGGGSVGWTPAYMLATLIVIAAAVMLAWRTGFRTIACLPLAARFGLIGIAVLPLLQLVPLPPALWQQLPGQELRLGTLSLAGLADTWQPLSLEPASTAITALLAAGFTVLTALLLELEARPFRRVMAVAAGVVVAGMAIGLLQVLNDGWPHLQINRSSANLLGFQANKNHMALTIACAMVLVGLVVAKDLLGTRRGRVAAVAFAALALVCIVATNSRAGLALGGIAGLIVLADAMRQVPLRWRLAALALGALLIAAVVGSDVFRVVGDRVGDVDDDLRWSFLDWSWPLVARYWSTGSGFGSFATLFAAHEQLAWVKPTYVNALHNDYLQLVLEGGVAGCAVLALLVIGVLQSVAVWRTLPPGDPRRTEAVAAYVILLLFALHSLVDYPLRRPAAAVFAALALAGVLRLWRPAAAPARPMRLEVE
ncbi:O-antigen ligase [Sphingomonas guangdongensis]|uniref:O-antigen ligase n=1 Tax=Sphingomonas guangdongensis TaxID=1141890 RepID=A0A285QKF9_9SPHN|nr:O-antigen ligase family protein [Sphingomonas guangdongensis]SOB80552.1 O-antigen ligase [Sphingomonas guangdongensis]